MPIDCQFPCQEYKQIYVNIISILNLDDINMINPNQIFRIILDQHEKSNKIFKSVLFCYDTVLYI